MEATKYVSVPYAETGYFSKIITDYLEGNDKLRPFYQHPPSIASFAEAMNEKKMTATDRSLLVSVLHAQYGDLQVHIKVKENIAALADENTFCLVTAHQLNIFTGPLYTIYKTLSTIQACMQLKQLYPDKNFVPVFWLGSEDHDFEEINHINLFGKTFTWPDKQGGACGRYSPASITGLIEELIPVLGDSEHAKYLTKIFSEAYLKNASLSHSALYYLNAIFGELGLVIVNGDDADLKKMCTDIISDELQNGSSFRIVQNTLEQFPYEAQAKPREINLFYLQPGSRERITWEEAADLFRIHNTNITFTREQMLQELNEHPENFSPNVILRPLFQQRVLPAVGFIGGGGEIAYWLQLKDLFQHYGIAFPVLMLRNSFLWLESAYAAKLDKLNIEVAEIFNDEETLVKQFIKSNAADSISLADKKAEFEKLYNSILAQSSAVDPTLEKAVLGEKQNALNALDKLEGKLLKAEKQKQETAIQKIRALKQKLFPLSGLQERHDNFMQYYVRYGPVFIDTILQNTNAFDPVFKVVIAE